MAGRDIPPRRDVEPDKTLRHAWQIPLRGWATLTWRIAHESLRDHVFIASSGIAFLALFALLPTLTALVSVYGMLSTPQQLSHQLQALSSFAPPSAIHALRGALHGIVRDSGVRLGLSAVLSICVALWVAVRGVLGIIGALNIVYDEDEKRSGPVLIGTALALAIGTLIFWMLALAVIVGAPWLIDHLALNSAVLRMLVNTLRWVVIAVGALISMAVLYRFGPSHTVAHWEWLSVGSFFGTALWLAGSAGLSLYLEHMGKHNGVFGSLGTIMVVMTWFFLTAFMFLLGAEFNIEVKRQARAHIGR